MFYNEFQSELVQMKIREWLDMESYSYFLTAKLPLLQKTESYRVATKRFARIMGTFERELIGRHWYKKHWRFVGSMETGDSGFWHIHLLFYNDYVFSEAQLGYAIFETWEKHNLAPDSLYLQEIDHTPERVNSYCLKEIRADINGHFNGDRFITSEILFNLPVVCRQNSMPALAGQAGS